MQQTKERAPEMNAAGLWRGRDSEPITDLSRDEFMRSWRPSASMNPEAVFSWLAFLGAILLLAWIFI